MADIEDTTWVTSQKTGDSGDKYLTKIILLLNVFQIFQNLINPVYQA